ncbi:MAG TPA: hypothetical protein DCP92_20690, partial [Nitrospiraceae bacterium]|nr:hypothetical protein [Nitrospiraceae bacterium]
MERREGKEGWQAALVMLAVAVTVLVVNGAESVYAAPQIEMVYVKGGCFQMGDVFGDGDSDEKPVHEVCVNDFYIDKYDVTQGQWKAIMGNNPSFFSSCGDNCPVDSVSWNDAQRFIKKLNAKM